MGASHSSEHVALSKTNPKTRILLQYIELKTILDFCDTHEKLIQVRKCLDHNDVHNKRAHLIRCRDELIIQEIKLLEKFKNVPSSY